MSETWLPVVGYEGDYEVSNLGNVRRLFSSFGWPALGLLTATLGKNGYCSVMLKRQRRKYVHTIVLEAFVGPRPEPSFDASHIDGIRTNNALSNLCWEPRSANHLRKVGHGTSSRGEAHSGSKLRAAQVESIRNRMQAGSRQADLAREYGVSPALICKIVKGKAWPHLAAV